jgi:uncharacterized protein involved in outer membrane biogenesis
VAEQDPIGRPVRGRRVPRWLLVPGVLVVLVLVLIALWDWNWFRPLVAAEASSVLGRRVTIGHLHVHLGRVTELVADDVEIANPDGFPAVSRLARVGRLTVQANVMDYIRHRQIVLPLIGLASPHIEAEALPDGKNNWTFPALTSKPANPQPAPATPSTSPQIGTLQISDGVLHALVPKLKADFTAQIATRAGPSGTPDDQQIVVDAKGTYAAQPVTGHFVGGALLSLRDAAKPYPIDLQVANGTTHVALKGTVEQPLTFGGANVDLSFSGQDMAQLYPLTGIPIPSTPPYSVTGKLDYADHRIRFDDFAGRLGSSDIGGTIAVDPGTARPKVDADLHSRRIDLADLGGFIGTTPGRVSTPDQTAQTRAKVERADASPSLLPTTPINLPKLRAADVTLRYDGEHIEGRSVPFDSLKVALDIADGHISVHPAALGVGTGSIIFTVDLDSIDDLIHAKADIDVRRVQLARLMAATHTFGGEGIIGGAASITTTGNSLAAMLGNGNGYLRLYMNGGNLSALLIDLSGLEFGNALLSALGVPSRATVQCFITDFALEHGIADAKTMLLSTSEANTYGSGDIDFKNQTLDMQLRTKANHFSIGTLPAPINIKGTFKNPSVAPGYADLGIRGGLAVGLGVLLPPLALLPTIQLGLGQDNACAKAMHPQG